MNLRQKCKKLKQENERLKMKTVYIVRKYAGNLLPYIKFEHIDNPNCGTTIIEGRLKVAEVDQIL